MSANAKSKILSTASQLFYAQGYHQTGINQIIEESKVAKASFYYHFASKEDLAIAYLEATTELLQTEMDELLDTPGRPGNKILQLFDRLYQWQNDPGYHGCVFLKLSSEFEPGYPPVQERVIRSKQGFRQFLLLLIGQLEFAPAVPLSPSLIADTLVTLFDGAATEALAVGDLWPIDGACKTVAALIGPQNLDL